MSISLKRKIVDETLVSEMRGRGLSWTEIAQRVDVSVSTLQRRRKEESFVEPLERISNSALDDLISAHVEEQPRRGEISIRAHIAVKGFNAPRQQVRDSIHRVDPEGVIARSRKPIQRRVYCVPGPHHLWHMDGNHKLIRWGIVIHGCIDGCTRNVIYLVARDNNKAETVLDAFTDGVHRYQLPLRVRGDLGGENVRVAEYMIFHRGVGHNAFLAGPSTHNTRIERLWRDMRSHTIEAFIQLFRDFEVDGMNLSNLLHIYTLQFIFIPIINQALLDFIAMWNKHKISTEHNRTPEQLLYYDLVGSTAPLAEEEVDPDTYGVEDFELDQAVGEDEEDGAVVNSVFCDPLECPLSTEEDLLEFRQRMDPLTANVAFHNFGTLYRQGLNIINDIYNRDH